MKIKLTLDKKYKGLADDIVSTNVPNISYFLAHYGNELRELAESEYGDAEFNNIVKIIKRIHSAAEIEWIEPKYKWRLKSEKFLERYIGHGGTDDTVLFYYTKAASMTESELKKLLEGTGLSFEAFEKVEADED